MRPARESAIAVLGRVKGEWGTADMSSLCSRCSTPTLALRPRDGPGRTDSLQRARSRNGLARVHLGSVRPSPSLPADLTDLLTSDQRARQGGLLGPATRFSSLLRHRACLALPLRTARLGTRRTSSRLDLVRTAARLARPHLAALRTLARTDALARPGTRTRPPRQEPRRELPPVRTRRRSRTLSIRCCFLTGTGIETIGQSQASAGEQVGRLYRPDIVARREAQVDKAAPVRRRPRPLRARSSPAGRQVTRSPASPRPCL